MLNKQTVDVAVNFSRSLVDKKLILEPQPNSILSELNSAVINSVRNMVLVNNNSEPEVCISDIVDNISRMADGDYIEANGEKSYALSKHDVLMDDYTPKLTNLVTNYIRFAKVVVNEKTKELYEAVISAIDGYKFKEPEDFFKVTYYKPQDIFTSSLIDSEISGYKTYNTLLVDPLNISKLTAEDINVNEYLLTGIEDIDSLITSWIASVDSNKILSYIVGDVREYELDVPELLNYSLANYLFYRNLTEKTDLNVGLTTLQLRSKASNNRNVFGYKVYMALELYRKNIRAKYLLTANSAVKISLMPFNDTFYNITVYEESFKHLAENGCPIESLFGFIANENEHEISADKLIERKDYYINVWNNVRSLYIIRMNNSRVDVVKNILSGLFISTLGEMSEEEKEARGTISNYDFEVNKRFNEYIQKLDAETIADLEQVCLDVVGNIRFYYSNAYYILSNMNKLLKLHEEMKPEEAALYSVIEYLVDFFCKQIRIVRF